MRLIGINGFKTSGKDTTYALVKELSFLETVERRAFADKLKIMAARALGYTGNDVELITIMDHYKNAAYITISFDGSSATHELTGREYLQNFGQRAREVFGERFWVDQVVPEDAVAFAKIWSTPTPDNGVLVPDIGCVTDVRYPNEALAIRESGGEVWEVLRPGLVSDGHDSEKPLPAHLIDTVVVNDGTIDDLREKVREALAC